MVGARFRRKLPGILATGLVTLTTTLWTFWGVGEMYYEGWWGAWYNRLPCLGLPAICLAFTLVAVAWPRVGGWILIVTGGAFTAWRWGRQAQLGALTVEWMLGWFPISGLLVITGLCRYLSEDGAALMPEPQDIWRMPTADEVVRSLVQGGESAGCTWDGVSVAANCSRQPNKDSPLWASDESPIYYWTADEYDAESAWYVPYTGGLRYGGSINHQPKQWGNARHGFRCVHEP